MSQVVKVMVVCRKCLTHLRPASQQECLDAIDGKIPHEYCDDCKPVKVADDLFQTAFGRRPGGTS